MNGLRTAGLRGPLPALCCALAAALAGCKKPSAESAARPAATASATAPEPASAPPLSTEPPAAPATPGDANPQNPAPQPASGVPKVVAPGAVPLRTATDEPPHPSGPIFQLPTKNDALFREDPAAFYMFVDRYGADGKVSQVWQGGGYGYVRNPRNTATGEVYTKFHEGIDIAPMQRDAAGEPQDIVNAIADGTVVYCAPNAASNYGNYIVIEHPCGEESGSFYSLYAHLRHIDTTVGTAVKRGEPIAHMGHTGEGIDRRRSHTHLELCMMLSDRFSEFYAKYYRDGNPYGNWHGHNLAGIDVASFLKAAHAKPGLTPAAFLKLAKPYYTVRIPNKTHQELEIARRYPWLRKPGDPGVSWEISYDTAGVPLSIAPSNQACLMPTVAWVKPSVTNHSWNTRNQLGGTGSTATLAPEGTRYQQLVSGDF